MYLSNYATLYNYGTAQSNINRPMSILLLAPRMAETYFQKVYPLAWSKLAPMQRTD
jgi:hypothetical protein